MKYPLPYYVVIFSSKKVHDVPDEYYQTNDKLLQDIQKTRGFLGYESVEGMTLSYWETLEAIKVWKNHTFHKKAQQQGRAVWYDYYNVKIAKVEREYEFQRESFCKE